MMALTCEWLSLEYFGSISASVCVCVWERERENDFNSLFLFANYFLLLINPQTFAWTPRIRTSCVLRVKLEPAVISPAYKQLV